MNGNSILSRRLKCAPSDCHCGRSLVMVAPALHRQSRWWPIARLRHTPPCHRGRNPARRVDILAAIAATPTLAPGLQGELRRDHDSRPLPLLTAAPCRETASRSTLVLELGPV